MSEANYVISVEEHASTIIKCVEDVANQAASRNGFTSLDAQFVFYKADYIPSRYTSEGSMPYETTSQPSMNFFHGDTSALGKLKLVKQPGIASCDLIRTLKHVKALHIPEKRLVLKFEQVDTEELKNVEIKCDGDRAIFKVGEGESSHYHIPNDKKLWETQFMICSIDGKFYIRDMGFVHTTRIKLDTHCDVQLQKGTVVDIGKVVHYHFDKLVHVAEPNKESKDGFYVLRQGRKYDIDADDFP